MASPKNEPCQAAYVVLSTQVKNTIIRDTEIVLDYATKLKGSPNNVYKGPTHPEWSIVEHVPNSYRIPGELIENMGTTRANMNRGFLPEFKLAYIIVDSEIVFWDYANKNMTSSYSVSEAILSIGLVKPRPNVFVKEIEYLLVIATEANISLTGVSFDKATRALTFYITNISVSPEGYHFHLIQGTKSGRILLCSRYEENYSKSSGVFELSYKEKPSWFSGRASLKNLLSESGRSYFSGAASSVLSHHKKITTLKVDLERDYLYVLYHDNTIDMHYIGGPVTDKPGDIRCLSRYAQPGFLSSEQKNTPRFIVSLFTVSCAEAPLNDIVLVALCRNGGRIFYKLQYASPYAVAGGNQITAVGYRPHAAYRPVNVMSTHLDYTGMAVREDTPLYTDPAFEHIDVQLAEMSGQGELIELANVVQGHPEALPGALLALEPAFSPDVNPVYHQATSFLSETGLCRRIDHVENVAITFKDTSSLATPSLKRNPIALQTFGSRKEWLIFGPQGIDKVVYLFPVDTLVAILRGHDAKEKMSSFLAHYNRNETCSMLLQIASHNYGTREGDMALTAESSAVTQAAIVALNDASGKPVSTDRSLSEASSAQDKTIFSGKFYGITLYFARLVRFLWSVRITKPAVRDGKSVPNAELQLDVGELASVKRNLIGLINVLGKIDPQMTLADFAPTLGTIDSMSRLLEQELVELRKAYHLILQTIETIAFVQLMARFGFHTALQGCDAAVQRDFAELTFEQLVTTRAGRLLADKLVNALIERQIAEHASVDAISNALNADCSSFCSANDVKVYRAKELFKRAERLDDDFENQRKQFQTAYALFLEAITQLAYEDVLAIARVFSQSGNFDLVVFLVLSYADVMRQELTPNSLPTPENMHGCYDTVCDALNDAAQADLTLRTRAEIKNAAYGAAVRYENQTFQYHLFETFLRDGKRDELLEFPNMFLPQFLKEDARDSQKLDLLWKYYVRHNQLFDATYLLYRMAHSEEIEYYLPQRIQHLSRALGNAKSALTVPTDTMNTALFSNADSQLVAFIKTLDAEIEVATIQMELFNILSNKDPQLSEIDREERRAAADKLNSNLLDLEVLFHDFAVPFKLREMQLVMFESAELHEYDAINQIWREILDEVYALPIERQYDYYSNTISRLLYRFRGSTVVLQKSLPHIVQHAERWTYETQREIHNRPDWFLDMLRVCGISWNAIFTAFDEVFQAQTPPWHRLPGQRYLLNDILSIVKKWDSEASNDEEDAASSPFNATMVIAALNRILFFYHDSDSGDETLAHLQDECRRIIALLSDY